MTDREAILDIPTIVSEYLLSMSSPTQHSPDHPRSPSPFVMPSPIEEEEILASTALSTGPGLALEVAELLAKYENVHGGVHPLGYTHGSPHSPASSSLASQVFPERIIQQFQELNRKAAEASHARVSDSSHALESGPTAGDLASRIEQLYFQVIASASIADSNDFEAQTTSTSFQGFRHRFESFHDNFGSPTPPFSPSDGSPFASQREPQLHWEELRAKLKHAYTEKLDNGILDSLTIQNTEDFVFFDVKYTHIGDYLEIGFARTPVQICIMNYNGEIVYQANLAMFDPRNGREVLSMVQWLDLVLDYQCTGAMSRRWYDVIRMEAAISNMRGYFWSAQIPRRTIHQIKNDLKTFNFRNKILFTHDGNLRPYDILRKLLPEATMPPRLITMSSYKLIKLILPDMPLNLYEFFYHLVDLYTLPNPEAPVIHKHIATEDTTYIRQIFSFFISAWENFQLEEGGRSRDDAPERLVDVWDGIPPDSPLFEPASDSDNEEDAGMTLSEVEALQLQIEREEELSAMEDTETSATLVGDLGQSRILRTHNSGNVTTEDSHRREIFIEIPAQQVRREISIVSPSDVWAYD